MEVVPMRRGAAMLICLLLPVAANSAVKERDINYESGSVVLRGSLAYDDTLPGRRPGLLVVHEWSGLNEHARHSARRLAEAGLRCACSRHVWGGQAGAPSKRGPHALDGDTDQPAR